MKTGFQFNPFVPNAPFLYPLKIFQGVGKGGLGTNGLNRKWRHFLTRNILRKVFTRFRSRHRRCSVRKGVLKNFAKFTGKNLCQSLFFNKVAGLSKKETLGQVFFCEFCETAKNTFFT